MSTFCSTFGQAGTPSKPKQNEPASISASPAPRIVNIVNFIRGIEPRKKLDLLKPVIEQIRLAHQYNLSTTFLIQYDALIRPEFVDLLKRELRPEDEVGAWLEVVQPQVEAAGLKWKGRYPWDWHTDVGFTVGYTPAERLKLMDVYMEQFKKAFGRFPRSVGCWVIDAPTLNYLADKYQIVAACICKDQSETDGYNLWGGYWNQAYYPSRENAFIPAQTAAEQVNVPIFRMLGSDPISQYGDSLGVNGQGVVSLEPVYPESGGNPAWVRWFFETNFIAPCLAFAYAQAGQENSFGWPAMSKGLTDQYRLFAEWSKAGRIRVETLGSSGEWFRKAFRQTPATAVVALTDPRGTSQRSIWYESRFYRVNFFWEGDKWRIRDLHMFNEKYPERYLNDRVATPNCFYDALPVLDGFHWSTREAYAGIRAVSLDGDRTSRTLDSDPPSVKEAGDSLLISVPLKTGGQMEISCEPSGLHVQVSGENAPANWALELEGNARGEAAIVDVKSKGIDYRYEGFSYTVLCRKGVVAKEGQHGRVLIRPNGKEVALNFEPTKD